MENNSKSQALVLVLIIVTIFASIVVTIGTLTARELEMREVDEMALNANYASDTAFERANEVINKGFAMKLDGVNDYIDVGQENTPLFDGDQGSYDQFTIEFWFKIESFKNGEFSRIISRGTAAGDPREGEIAVAGDGVVKGTNSYNVCPRRLHMKFMTPWNTFDWFPITEINNNCSAGPEIKANKWYHVTAAYVATMAPAWYFYVDEPDESRSYQATMYLQAPRNEGIQGGAYNLRIGAALNNTNYFDGVIDEVRIYKHPRFCGTPATFYPNIDPGQSTDPNDPRNHYFGGYGYQDNIPPCFVNLVCAAEVCNAWNTDLYYPEGYNMETHDLELYYRFEEGGSLANCTGECITDDSPGGNNNGTPVGFSDNDVNSGWTMPASPDSKGPIPLPLTDLKEVITVNRDSIGSGACWASSDDDCNPMENEYSYSFDIIPYGRDINSNSCSCSPPAAGCCCNNYCIDTAGQSP